MSYPAILTDVNGNPIPQFYDPTTNAMVPAGSPSQAATQGITATSQVSVGATTTPIFNGVVNGQQIAIANTSTSTTLYIGTSSVTTSIGYPIAPNGTFTMDVVSGSTIVIYGIASSSITVATMTIN